MQKKLEKYSFPIFHTRFFLFFSRLVAGLRLWCSNLFCADYVFLTRKKWEKVSRKLRKTQRREGKTAQRDQSRKLSRFLHTSIFHAEFHFRPLVGRTVIYFWEWHSDMIFLLINTPDPHLMRIHLVWYSTSARYEKYTIIHLVRPIIHLVRIFALSTSWIN